MQRNRRTTQTPIAAPVYLYTKTGDRGFVSKLKKHFPETYLAVKIIMTDSDFKRARKITVREGGFGFAGLLLAKATEKLFYISLWSSSSLAIINFNIEKNIGLSKVVVVVETHPSESCDVAILTHANYQSNSSLLNELIGLTRVTKGKVIFIVTHKKKGAKKLIESLRGIGGVEIEKMKAGRGGVRILKLRIVYSNITKKAATTEISYVVENKKIIFHAVPSIFSPNKVDDGTNLLIKHVLRRTKRKSSAHILDLCCGYGAIGLSLAKARPNFTAVLSDNDKRAVQMAEINNISLKLSNRVDVLHSDGARDVWGKFDILTSNPPLHVNRKALLTILSDARAKVIKGGTIFIVVEKSQEQMFVKDFRSRLGYLKPVKKTKTHVVLEGKK